MTKKEDSFTLMELIATIVIIGILTSIALPGLFKSIEKNRQAEAINILTRMYKGYKILIIDEIINPAGDFMDGVVFNPDESNILPVGASERSDISWKALAFPQNINYQYTNLYFSYDFLKVGEKSYDRSDCIGTPPTATGAAWAIAYRKLSNNKVTGTELYPVDFNKRIYIYMNNGTIVKSSDY